MNLVQKLAQNLLLSVLHADIKRNRNILRLKKQNLKILRTSKSLTVKRKSSKLCPLQKQFVPNAVIILHISGKNRQVVLKKPLLNSSDVQNANILGAQIDSRLFVLINNKVNKYYSNIEF